MKLASQLRPDLGVDLGRIVPFEHAQLKFVRSCHGITYMYEVTVNQLVAPDPCIGEWSRNGAADATRVVFDDKFAQRGERRFR